MSLLLLYGRQKPRFSLNMMGFLPSAVTFTRADAIATYQDSDGLIKTAAVDQPRIDWDYKNPGTPTLKGLLFETTRTNICLHGRDLTNAVWTKSNITAAKTQIGVDGVVNSASSITATAANGTCLQAITQASAARSFSCYIKRLVGTGNIDITHDAGSTWTTLTVTSSWSRVHITQTIANSSVGFRIVTSGDSVAIDYCQDEATGGTPSSAIATAGTAVTRESENAVVSGAAFTNWFVPGPGTLYLEFETPQLNTTSVRAGCAINDGTNDNHYNILISTATGTGRFQESSAADGVVSITIDTVPALNTIYKYGMAWDTDTSVITNVNGQNEGTDTSISLPTGLNQLLVGTYSTGINRGNIWIRHIKYFNRKMTLSELDALCT
jgi:hypothetical protein